MDALHLCHPALIRLFTACFTLPRIGHFRCMGFFLPSLSPKLGSPGWIQCTVRSIFTFSRRPCVRMLPATATTSPPASSCCRVPGRCRWRRGRPERASFQVVHYAVERQQENEGTQGRLFLTLTVTSNFLVALEFVLAFWSLRTCPL